MRKSVIVVLFLCIGLVLGGCATNPTTGQVQISPEWKDATCETALAAYEAADVILNSPTPPDQDAKAYWNTYKSGAKLFLNTMCGKSIK